MDTTANTLRVGFALCSCLAEGGEGGEAGGAKGDGASSTAEMRKTLRVQRGDGNNSVIIRSKCRRACNVRGERRDRERRNVIVL